MLIVSLPNRDPAVRVLLLLVLLAVCIAAAFANASELPDRYWPSFPAPKRVLISESHNALDFPEGLLLQTLSGLVAYTARTRGLDEMIWIGLDSPSYAEWLNRWRTYQGVSCDSRVFSVWELVDRFHRRGIIKGYILCRKDGERTLYEGKPANTSVNVATALCALLGGVAIEENIENKAQAHGLHLLFDARGKDEPWLWRRYGRAFSRSVLARQDPKSYVMRESAVAMRATLLSETGPLYEQALARLRPCSPILGWGIGLEDAQTGPSSRFGALQTATNWCANLPLLAAGRTGLDYPFKPFPQRAEELVPNDSDTRYVSFLLTDGDNVQWLMLNFCKGDEAQQYWACPERGAIPFGWTVPAMDLLQLCPYTLDYLRETATPNDDFILLGGGYYYPDWFGSSRPEKDLLAQHARRTGEYMAKCGLTKLMVNMQDWDSEAAMQVYETYAREMPSLEGLFVIQYAPYTAGAGAIRWITRENGRALPVITPRHAIWSQRAADPREGAPGEVAAWLNEWAKQPVRAEEDRFAWVIVHCWSWFRHTEPSAAPADEEVQQESKPEGADIARGYRPSVWSVERLSSTVRVVAPSELLKRLYAAHGTQPGDVWRAGAQR